MIRSPDLSRGGRLGRGVWSCSLLALALATPCAAWAQEAQEPSVDADTAKDASQDEDNPERIVVIGQRIIVAALEDVEPEDEYDEDRLASYGLNTVGEILGEIRSENGDVQPSILVNGQPVRDLGDISDLPVEAIRRIEQLPRGSAQRVSGAPGERAYNVVLKPQVRLATVTLSTRQATEGGRADNKGEVIGTYIRGQDRLNLTIRRTSSDQLFESDRDLVPRPEAFPYAALGNIVPSAGAAQIDPAFSAQVGQAVTVIGLDGRPQPSAGDLAARANLANPSEAANFRALLGASKVWQAGFAGNKELTEALSLSGNGMLSWTDSKQLRGLPSALFTIPASNLFNPFSTPVSLALSDLARPLASAGQSRGKTLSATLNGEFGPWSASLLARYDERKTSSVSDTTGVFAGGGFILPDNFNPFDGSLASAIPVDQRTAFSRNIERQVAFDAQGPIAMLPAGPLLVRGGLGALWTSFDADDQFSGPRGFDRHELTAKAGVTVPLTGNHVLRGIGQSDLALDIGRVDLGRYGTIHRYAAALNWTPVAWLHVAAGQSGDGTPIYPELLAAPRTVTDNVLYFDPVRKESVSVRLISSGASGLLLPHVVTRNLSLTATPLAENNLRLTLDYQDVAQRNLIGAIPFPSSAIVAAFPERFVRDASGRLTEVDTSAVNFARQDTSQIRAGVSFKIDVTPTVIIPRNGTTPPQRFPGTVLQVNLAHTHLLDSTTVIRPGLPQIDLLAGGAIGIGGGQQRDFTSLTAALARGPSGLRINARYRGPSYLQTGTVSAPDTLTFKPVAQVDVNAFTDLTRLFRGNPVTKSMRVSLAIENLFNDGQRVFDQSGVTPQAYQPVYRDPVGRTVTVELRKVF